jgi:hypothetical protein
VGQGREALWIGYPCGEPDATYPLAAPVEQLNGPPSHIVHGQRSVGERQHPARHLELAWAVTPLATGVQGVAPWRQDPDHAKPPVGHPNVAVGRLSHPMDSNELPAVSAGGGSPPLTDAELHRLAPQRATATNRRGERGEREGVRATGGQEASPRETTPILTASHWR